MLTWWGGRCLGLFCFLVGWGGGVVAGEVRFVPARDYFETVESEIARATSTISVCLYSFSFRPHQSESPVFALAQSLKRAHDRGVQVDVLLDQNIDFLGTGDLSEGKNTPVYQFLRAQGIPVFFDSPSSYTHSKVVVIDGETVLLGSSNWTDSAFNRNVEANVLIRSTDVARDVLASVRAIPRQGPLPNNESEGVDVPGEFLEDPDLFGRMATRSDSWAFDTYLFLLKEQSVRDLPWGAAFVLDDLKLAEGLGTSARKPSAYRRQNRKVLNKLQDFYGLLSFQVDTNKNVTVTLTPFPGERTAFLPLPYWSLGWDRELLFREKCFYLVSQYESAVSTRRPRWSAAQKTLMRRYGGTRGFYGAGATGLRRRNLLEIEYAPYTGGEIPRRPTFYTPNALYDPVELKKSWEALKIHYGNAAFTRAQMAAAVVFEDSDVKGILQLILLENQYGTERVDEAVRLMKKKNPDSHLRNLGYLIGMIRMLD